MAGISEMAASIKEAAKERLLNPFLTAFLVSWSVVNYQIPVALLSDGDYQQKIFYIESILIRDSWDAFMKFVALPLLGVGTYLLVVPILTTLTIVIQELTGNLYTSARAIARRHKFLTRQESLELNTRHTSELRIERDRANDQLAALKNFRATHESQLAFTIRIARTLCFELLQTKRAAWTEQMKSLDGGLFEGNPGAMNLLNQPGLPAAWIEMLKSHPRHFHLNDAIAALKTNEAAELAVAVLATLNAISPDLTIADAFIVTEYGRTWAGEQGLR